MRKLTLTREKSFVGSIGKLKVYIENEAGELDIQGTKCRYLGELKNGQTAEYLVDNAPAKVYVIADELSKNYCNDFYQLPEGDQDVELSGVCKLNPGAGNAFRFNGNEDNQEAMAQRSKNKKKGWLILLLSLLGGMLIGALVGFASCSAIKSAAKNSLSQPKTFSTDEMSIVLTRQFVEEKVDSFHLAASSNKVAVLVQKQPFMQNTEFKTMSIDNYTKLVTKSNGRPSLTIKAEGDARYFEYDFTDPASGQSLHYWVYTYKGVDEFWLINFSCLKSDEAAVRPSISKWATSATFK